MGLNCLIWLLAIVVVDQLQLYTMVSLLPLFSNLRAAMQRLLDSGTDVKVVGDEGQKLMHP